MYQIALDGPPGSGKSTLGKKLAASLNILYLDSGAVYRAFAYKILTDKADFNSKTDIEKVFNMFNLNLESSGRITLNGEDVTSLIREQRVADAVKHIGENPDIRAFITRYLQNLARGCSVVMDGRDVASTILPEAKYKYFLVCELETRAKRAYDALVAKGENPNFEDIREAISRREEVEKNRRYAPVVRHPESTLIDTTDMTIDELIAIIKSDIEKAGDI